MMGYKKLPNLRDILTSAKVSDPPRKNAKIETPVNICKKNLLRLVSIVGILNKGPQTITSTEKNVHLFACTK